MNEQSQAKPAPPRPPITTPIEARKLAEEMLDVMTRLLAVIERERQETAGLVEVRMEGRECGGQRHGARR